MIEQALPDTRRSAPVELISFQPSAADCIGPDGTILLDLLDLERRQWP